jgi:hypothetical protein
MDLYDRVAIAISMVTGMHYVDGGYVSAQLMTICSALEALHHGLVDDESLMPAR